MMQGGNGASISEVKLAWAYTLLSNGFAEMTEALARIDQNAAWGMLAVINGRVTRTLREEGVKLGAKGYPPGELKQIADRLSETIMAAGQAINTQRDRPKTPVRTIDAQREPLAFAALVREAQHSNRSVA